MSKMLQQLAAAKAVSTPLIAIRTPDAAATINSVAAWEDNMTKCPLLQWDAVRGLTELNPLGKQVIKELGDIDAMINPIDMLVGAVALPKKSYLFVHNAQRLINELPFIQALWNLRDPFIENNRTVVLLCPDVTLPPELVNDVFILDEPLPNDEQLAEIVRGNFEAADVPLPDESVINKAVDALVGLAAFPADQVTAMSMSPSGLNMESVWDRKVSVIEQQPGLTVWRGKETFDDVAGCANVKGFLSKYIANTIRPIRAVMWFDEIDKAFAGLGQNGGPGDNTGVTQDQMGQFLKWWEDKKIRAVLLTGFPGTGKSLIAKATGGQAGVPTLEADTGAMKGSHVGESERMVRNVIKVSEAMAPDGSLLVIATCNMVNNLPPELLSRFRRGQFFFDLPTSAERKPMWALHLAKNGLSMSVEQAQEQVNETNWTGREIEACCSIAADLQCSIMEAATYVVPVAKTMGKQIETLREFASGRFLSANELGFYEAGKAAAQDEATEVATHRGSRKRGMDLEN